MKKLFCIFFLFIMSISTVLLSQEKADIIVSKDGKGNFTSIQDAINSIPENNKSNVIILIKNGIYNEKIFITKSFITLVGENRDSTKVVYPELRENWVREHKGSDWGAGVVNIDTAITDITLANITISNNYGSLYGVYNKHQFTIRGAGTKIIIINCNVLSDGGDTVSLWDKENGMYYHAFCYFQGWVDYVCPRGWCYITDSRFFGHNLSASIWHDGDKDKNQKFVIRYSFFDGVPGFPLARHHRDGQFYLLDCIFSRNLADTPIYYPKSPTSVPWKWGARHYFYNCHREGGDYDWLRDNLETAENSPKEKEINAKWTFDGRWDPEENIPAVLPFVFLPTPRDGSYLNSEEEVILKWLPARNAKSHRIHFGKTKRPEFLQTINKNYFNPGKLERKTIYFWRIDEIIGKDTIKGPLWHFTIR